MSRTINIAGKRLEVSKTEAEQAKKLIAYTQGTQRQIAFETWLTNSPTPEARTRRQNVGIALGLKV